MKKLILLLSLSISISVLAKGAGSSGGGNEIEGDFASIARRIYISLMKKPLPSEAILGIRLFEYLHGLDTIEPHCAVDDILKTMRELRKKAYYFESTGNIHIDCDLYYQAKEEGELGPITVFHEYMRAIGKESSEYQISSKLDIALENVGANRDLFSYHKAIVTCHEKFQETARILRGIHSKHGHTGAMLQMATMKCFKDNKFNKKVDVTIQTFEFRKAISSMKSDISLRDFAELMTKFVKENRE